MAAVVALADVAVTNVMRTVEGLAKDQGVLLTIDALAVIETAIAHTTHMVALCVRNTHDREEIFAGLAGVESHELADAQSARIAKRIGVPFPA